MAEEAGRYCWGIVAPMTGHREELEEDFGKPVMTNATARARRLMHEGIAPPKPGWGALLAAP